MRGVRCLPTTSLSGRRGTRLTALPPLCLPLARGGRGKRGGGGGPGGRGQVYVGEVCCSFRKISPFVCGLGMSMGFVNPVSSGKYSGTFVFGSSRGAHCDVVHSPSGLLYHRCHCNCCDLVLFVDSLRGCLRRDVVWWSWWCLRFYLGQREVDYWKIRGLLFPVPRGCGCVCMLNFWFSRYDTICADNYIYFRFYLQACVAVRSGSCICMATRPSRWTVIVRKCYPGVCLRLALAVSVSVLHPIWQRSHTIYVLCLPSERGMGMSMYLAVPVSSGSTAGRACPLLQLCICRDVLHSHVT